MFPKVHSPHPKVRATFYVEPELLEAARDAAYHLAGHPAHLTLTTLVNDALHAELQRLRKAYTQGEAFPKREASLKGGRPLAA